MVSETQAAHVIALVRERHGAVKQSFDKLLDALARADQAQIITANDKLLVALIELRAVIAGEHWPKWLKDLLANCENYRNNHNNGLPTWKGHLSSIIENYQNLSNEEWNFGQKDEIIFDIDEIIAHACSEYKIHDLYDKIIDCLNAIIKSGHVDSVKATSDLEKILSSLRSAKNGSFASQVFNWKFARRLIPNVISAYSVKNPVVGPLIEAFEKTAIELDVSLERVKDQIGAEIIAAASGVLKTNCTIELRRDSLFFLEHAPPSN